MPPQVAQLAGYQTIEIVERIRCEARTAIQAETLSLLKEDDDPANAALALYLEAAPDHWRTDNIKRNLLSERQKQFYDRYIESGMALDFTFDLAESNRNAVEIDLLKAISNGTFGLNVAASDEHKRGNRQQFLISETFGHLLDDEIVCLAPRYDPLRRSDNFGVSNGIAPITGFINIREVIHLFIQINREGILKQKKDDAAPTLADTLMFTTTYSGSVNPSVAISPIGRALDFKLASFTGGATRMDINQVLIGLSLNPKSKVAAKLVQDAGSGGGLFRGQGAAAFARKIVKPSETRAIAAVSQQKIDTYLDRFNLLLR